MLRNMFLVSLLGIASTGSALAQTCSCAPGATLVNSQAVLVTLLSNKMACGVVGNEQWQEWHNGSTASGGPLIDFKKGPGDRADPSTTVGTYSIGSGATVTYNYSGGSTFTYEVCTEGTATGGVSTVHFCGGKFGGRDITNAKVGGSGLQSCVGVQ